VTDFAVEAKELTKRFGDFVAVDHVTLEVPAGSIYGFLGPNGAGKTTTIKMLCGLERPTSGSARVAGCDIERQTHELKERIGYMSQAFSLYEDLTVDQNIRFFGDVYRVPKPKLAERRAFVLSMAGLEGQEKRLSGTLAVGWKQRLALGCAVLHEPRVLFLDEPTAGVDPLGRRQFWDLIYALAARGVTVFVTTHYMDEAENCATVAFLRDGKLVASGDPAAMRREHDDRRLIRLSVPVSRGSHEQVAAALRAWPAIERVSPFGSAFHVRSAGAPMDPAEVTRYLSAKGLEPEYVQPIRPSLEDVFLKLVERDSPLVELG
jgi:ABC-2 type transport system ATP-binding protein